MVIGCIHFITVLYVDLSYKYISGEKLAKIVNYINQKKTSCYISVNILIENNFEKLYCKIVL